MSSLRVARVVRRVFGGVSDGPLDPELRQFVADMVRPYGNELREDLLESAHGHAYAIMAEELMVELRSAGLVSPERPVDLLVLASAIHDTQMARPSATYLSHICPGNPMSFAICDQGIAGAHTALRLVRDYAATGDARRALLILAEQATLHYEPSVVDGPQPPVPARPAVVALLCEEDGASVVVGLRQHHHVAPGDAGALLAAEVAELAAGRTDVTLVLGEGLAPLAGPGVAEVGRVVVAPPGQPFTGAWLGLADVLDTPTGDGLVLLADYDPSLRYLCVSAVDLTGADPRPGLPLPVGERHG